MPSVDEAAILELETAANTPLPYATDVQAATGNVLSVQVMPSVEVALLLELAL
jgi:hypothetical protein